jgi:hypothetical protein
MIRLYNEIVILAFLHEGEMCTVHPESQPRKWSHETE